MDANLKEELDRKAYRTAYLLAGFIKGTITDIERKELDTWMLADKNNMDLFLKLTNKKQLAKALAEAKTRKPTVTLEEISKKLNLKADGTPNSE
ncbi:MAG: hypothetical protein WDN26_16780 [Chitinophagaceae bacterium]